MDKARWLKRGENVQFALLLPANACSRALQRTAVAQVHGLVGVHPEAAHFGDGLAESSPACHIVRGCVGVDSGAREEEEEE